MNTNYVAMSHPIFELIELKVMYHIVHVFIFYLGKYDIEASKEASKKTKCPRPLLKNLFEDNYYE